MLKPSRLTVFATLLVTTTLVAKATPEQAQGNDPPPEICMGRCPWEPCSGI